MFVCLNRERIRGGQRFNFNLYFTGMSTLRLSAGINKDSKLPDTQVVLIGRNKHIKALKYASVAEKLCGVDEKVFTEALKQLDAEGGSIPLYLNLAKVIRKIC